MKKVLSLLFVFSLFLFFASCSEDEKVYNWRGNWNDPKDPNYKAEGYNPVKGMWKGNTIGLYFSEDFKIHDVSYLADGSYQIALYRDTYIINDEAFRYEVYPQTIRYKVEGDKLYITEKLFDDDWAVYTRYIPAKTEE